MLTHTGVDRDHAGEVAEDGGQLRRAAGLPRLQVLRRRHGLGVRGAAHEASWRRIPQVMVKKVGIRLRDSLLLFPYTNMRSRNLRPKFLNILSTNAE